MHGIIDYARAAISFGEARYLYVKHLLPEPVLHYMQAYCDILRANDKFRKDDQHSLAIGGDLAFDALLCWIRPSVSRLVGFDLAPTYSYACIYTERGALSRYGHRAGHEISVAIPIEIPKHADPLVLHLEAPNMPEAKIEMSEGDGCIYDERGVEHWSGPIRQHGYIQLFLHFIDQRALAS